MKLRILISAVLVTALALPVIATVSRFPDVPANHQHADAIRWASDPEEFNGNPIFRGFPDGNFGPDQELTENQFNKVVARLFDTYDSWTRAQTAALLYYGFQGLKSNPFVTTTSTTTTTQPVVTETTTTIQPQNPDTIQPEVTYKGIEFHSLSNGITSFDITLYTNRIGDQPFSVIICGKGQPIDLNAEVDNKIRLHCPSDYIIPLLEVLYGDKFVIIEYISIPNLQVGFHFDESRTFFLRWVRPGWENQGWKWRVHSDNPNCGFTDGAGGWQINSGGWSNGWYDDSGRALPFCIDSGTYNWHIEIIWDNGHRFVSNPCIIRGFSTVTSLPIWDCNSPDWSSWPRYYLTPPEVWDWPLKPREST